MKKLVLISAGILAALAFSVSAFAAEKTYNVAMSGNQESPKGDPNGKGTAKVKIEAAKGEICFKFTWSGIGTPSAAHIHKGKKGVAGPVVVPFFGGAAKRSGCVKASKSLLSKIVKSPGSYYVNLHNAKYPNGALRGQL
jgi:TRAP-type C4-dicarboxylate transport system substrate-binding protein